MTDILLILSHILALYLGYKWGRFTQKRHIKNNLWYRMTKKGNLM